MNEFGPETNTPASDGEDHLDALVTSVLAEQLDQDTCGPDDNFFLLGGDSLLAATAARQLSRKAGLPVSAEHIFLHPTARELSEFLRTSVLEASR